MVSGGAGDYRIVYEVHDQVLLTSWWPSVTVARSTTVGERAAPRPKP